MKYYVKDGETIHEITVDAEKVSVDGAEVVARLEDLAGNNLQRLFDRDILTDSVHEVKEYKRSFYVR